MIFSRSLYFVFLLIVCFVLATRSQLLVANNEGVENRYESINQDYEGFLKELRIACSESLSSGIAYLQEIQKEAGLCEINRIRLINEEAYLQMEVHGIVAAKALLDQVPPLTEEVEPLLYAQYRRVDALKVYLEHPQGSARESSEIYHEILPLLIQSGAVFEVVETFVSLSYDYEVLDETDKALDILYQARDYAVEHEDPISIAIVDSSLGYWAFYTESPNMELIENLNLASQFFRKSNNQYQLLLANMALLFNQPHVSNEEELVHLNSNIELAKNLGAKESLCGFYKLKASYYGDLEYWDKAIHFIQEGINLALELNNEDIEFWHSIDLSQYLVYANQPGYDEQAFELTNRLLKIAVENGDKYAVAFLKLNLANILFRKDKYAETISLLDDSIEFFVHNDYLAYHRKASVLKSKALYQQGHLDDAYKSLKVAYDIGENGWKREYKEELAVASIYLNNTVQENELKLTQMANELAQTQIAEQSFRIKYQDQQAKQNQYRLKRAVFLFVVLFVLFLLLAISFQRKKRAGKELKLLTHALQKEKELLLKEHHLHLEANKELHASIIRQKEIDEDRKTILGIAAHDMKNPLAAIESTLEMAKLELQEMDLPKDSLLFEYLGLCFESSEYLGKLIQNILRARKSDSEADFFDMRWINPVPVVEQTIAMNQQNAIFKGMRLQFSPNGKWVVKCDSQGLREALDNLLSNAIKYSFHGAVIEILLKHDGDRLVFEVKDGGPGLLESDMENIFKPFSKLSANPTGGENSNGLGLSSVKRVVEAMNGEVFAENRPEGGAVFSLSLETRCSEVQETTLRV